MTVHCFEVTGSVDISEKTANQRVDDHLFSKFNDILPEQHDLLYRNLDGESEFLKGVIRFEMNESKQDILEKIKNEIVHDLSWYKIRYHECNHDSPDEDEGDWSILSEHGTIPDYV